MWQKAWNGSALFQLFVCLFVISTCATSSANRKLAGQVEIRSSLRGCALGETIEASIWFFQSRDQLLENLKLNAAKSGFYEIRVEKETSHWMTAKALDCSDTYD